MKRHSTMKKEECETKTLLSSFNKTQLRNKKALNEHRPEKDFLANQKTSCLNKLTNQFF